MPPFQALYGVPPPTVHQYLSGTTSVHVVDVVLRDRDSLLQLLKNNLRIARNRMKQQADRHHTDREFQIGEWVFF